MSQREAPDFFEPIIGWRCWSQIDRATGGLKALTNNYYWLPGKPLQAICPSCGGPSKPTITQHDFDFASFISHGNHIGMYAFKTLHQLVEDRAFGLVVGQVKLWGTIAEHTRGYRAEFAYPHALIVNFESDAEILREKWYGVEVAVGNLHDIYNKAKERLIRNKMPDFKGGGA